MVDTEGLMEKIRALALSAGRIMKEADRSHLSVDAKEGHANFVTAYDTLIQEKLKEGLGKLLPEAGFFGEEGEDHHFPEAEYVFIVDPIDGTTNFMKDLSLSCVAISLTRKRERILSVVYNPYTEEMFTAIRGRGAFLNDRTIHVSDSPLDRGIVIFGTSAYYEKYPEIAFAKAQEYLKKCIDVRRFGSAELDLCYVACGRAELYFEPLIQPWDFAAGSLIVEEAGGRVSQWDGSDLDVTVPCGIMAYGSGVDLSGGL